MPTYEKRELADRDLKKDTRPVVLSFFHPGSISGTEIAGDTWDHVIWKTPRKCTVTKCGFVPEANIGQVTNTATLTFRSGTSGAISNVIVALTCSAAVIPYAYNDMGTLTSALVQSGAFITIGKSVISAGNIVSSTTFFVELQYSDT